MAGVANSSASLFCIDGAGVAMVVAVMSWASEHFPPQLALDMLIVDVAELCAPHMLLGVVVVRAIAELPCGVVGDAAYWPAYVVHGVAVVFSS